MKFSIALLFFAVALANAKQWKTLRPLVDPLRPAPPAPSERIVGGHETVPHAYPHQVALHIDNMYFCGGSLISLEIVLTAGHCLHNHYMAEVTAGAHNQRKYEESQVIQTSYSLTTHENYDAANIHNDIAFIRMSKPFPFNENIQPTCYNGLSNPDVGIMVTPTGWGVYSDAVGALSDVLREVDVPIMSNSDCNSYYGIIYDGSICINAAGGKGTCNGDSGGPLNYEGRTYGITSFGSSRGCEAGFPDAFTRTSHFADWITENAEVAPC